MAGHASREDRRHERILSFAPCDSCEFDLATGDGERSCHYFDCPYLPEELTVRCPTCLYNFATGDGNPNCSDPPSCRFARVEAPQHLALVREWQARHAGVPAPALPG